MHTMHSAETLSKAMRVLIVTVSMKNFVRRYCSVKHSEKVRVRFAPSPTGYLHLGGLRTALYNYLFAKASNGTFILRIEDTDQSRLVEGAAEKLENELEWAGIEPDESPRKGGSFGPYRQSERLFLYRKYAELLVETGHGYRCFCSPRRLDLLRRESVRTHQIPRYDNRCRTLMSEEIQKKLDKNTPYCIRFKLAGEGSWNDLVLGPVNPNISAEGDPIVLKTDGYPTYHLACVVDDHLMEVTHVLRGVEWQISTPKHLQIYRALDWQPPSFGHLPLLLNSDGTKLSKRQGGVTVEEQRSAGVYPRALVTWLTLAGGGFQHFPEGSSIIHSELKAMTPVELVPLFDLSKIHRASCRLPLEHLPHLNQIELGQQLNSEDGASQLASELRSMLQRHYAGRPEASFLQLEERHILEILQWALPRIHSLHDFLSPKLNFLWEQPCKPIEGTEDETKALKEVFAVLSTLPQSSFEKKHLSLELKTTAKQTGIPFSHLMKLMRIALSGKLEGPGVAEMLEMLGPNASLSRLNSVITSQR